MEWISVEDRLPDKTGAYLVHTDNGVVENVTIMMVADGVWWTTGWSGDVTHWMPLPEPPDA